MYIGIFVKNKLSKHQDLWHKKTGQKTFNNCKIMNYSLNYHI